MAIKKKYESVNEKTLCTTTVAEAEDIDLAVEYAELLRTHGIDAEVEHDASSGAYNSIEIKVPDNKYDEAYVVIQARQEENRFMDYLFNEMDSSDEYYGETYFDD